MRRRRTILAATAAAGALVVTAAACAPGGGGDDDSGGGGADAAVDDGVITIFSQQGAEVDLNTNSFTLLLEEEFDVDLQFETTTWDAASASEARQITLASGDYPDAFLLIPWVDIFSQSELIEYGEQGVIRPLNDLITENGPNLQNAFAETSEWERITTAPDGSVFGLSQWNDCFHCTFPSKLWMNSAWLDAVGMDQPTTPEELRAVLTAFKNEDPNGNGQADEVALSGFSSSVMPYLMNPFVYMGNTSVDGSVPSSLALDGDTVTLQPTRDEWREGLQYVHSLFEEDLLDGATFTQNQDAILTLGDNAGETILGSTVTLHPGTFVTIEQEDGRDANYDAVPPLTGPDGASRATLGTASNPGGAFVITNHATDDEAATLVEIVDWMVDYENQLRAQWGEEGVAWDFAQEGDVALDETMEPLYVRHRVSGAEASANSNASWGPLTQYYISAEFRGSEVVPEDIYSLAGYERRLFEATIPYSEVDHAEALPYWQVWIPEDKAADLADAQTNIENLVMRANAEFVTGVRDIDDDAAWQAFQDELAASGAETYLSIYQEAWDARG